MRAERQPISLDMATGWLKAPGNEAPTPVTKTPEERAHIYYPSNAFLNQPELIGMMPKTKNQRLQETTKKIPEQRPQNSQPGSRTCTTCGQSFGHGNELFRHLILRHLEDMPQNESDGTAHANFMAALLEDDLRKVRGMVSMAYEFYRALSTKGKAELMRRALNAKEAMGVEKREMAPDPPGFTEPLLQIEQELERFMEDLLDAPRAAVRGETWTDTRGKNIKYFEARAEIRPTQQADEDTTCTPHRVQAEMTRSHIRLNKASEEAQWSQERVKDRPLKCGLEDTESKEIDDFVRMQLRDCEGDTDTVSLTCSLRFGLPYEYARRRVCRIQTKNHPLANDVAATKALDEWGRQDSNEWSNSLREFNSLQEWEKDGSKSLPDWFVEDEGSSSASDDDQDGGKTGSEQGPPQPPTQNAEKEAQICNLSVDITGAFQIYNLNKEVPVEPTQRNHHNRGPDPNALNDGGDSHAKGPQPATNRNLLTVQGYWDRKEQITIKILVDTGCAVSALKRSELLRILTRGGLTPTIGPLDSPLKLRPASGHLLPAIGKTTVAMKLGGKLFERTYFVFEELPFPCVLGMDFVNDTQAMTDTAEGVLVIRRPVQARVPITHEYKQPAAPIYLLITEFITLKPGAWTKVPTRLSREVTDFSPERRTAKGGKSAQNEEQPDGRITSFGIGAPLSDGEHNSTNDFEIQEGLYPRQNGNGTCWLKSTRPYHVIVGANRIIGSWTPVKTDVEGWKKQKGQATRQQIIGWREKAAYEFFLLPQAIELAKQAYEKAPKAAPTPTSEDHLQQPSTFCAMDSEDWDAPEHEDQFSAPVEDVVLEEDLPCEASTDDIVAQIVETAGQLSKDGGAIKRQPKKEARLVRKLARLYDILKLFNESDEDYQLPEGTEPPELTFRAEHYAHLSESELELTKRTISEVSSFFRKEKTLGLIKTNRPVVIDVGDAAPRSSGYIRLNEAEQKVVDEYVKKLIEADCVEKSNSPWSSPILLVPKTGGGLRAVSDLRQLNKVAVRDVYPTPDVTETLEEVAGHKWITKIDLTSAFWQLPLHKKSRPFTAFNTRSHGHLQWKRLPMGYVNSSNVFQREIDHSLGPMRYMCSCAFCDDVAVYSDGTLEDHLRKVKAVIRALLNAGFTGNIEKSLFAQKKTDFLGHMVSEKGIEMQPTKYNAMLSCPPPASKASLRRFLGLTGYYRRFIEHFGTIATPLTSLLAGTTGSKRARKVAEKHPWPEGAWNDEHDSAFRALKGALMTAPVLALPKKGRRYVLATDASKVCFGAVLSQYDENKQEHPIFYLSKKLLESERKWDIWEIELAAAVWATAACRPYLIGHEFDLVTDSSVVERLLSKDLPTRRSNWVLRLSAFKYKVVHRVGKANANADFFSRMIDAHEQTYNQWEEGKRLTEAVQEKEGANDTSGRPEDHWECDEAPLLFNEVDDGSNAKDAPSKDRPMQAWLAKCQHEEPGLAKIIENLKRNGNDAEAAGLKEPSSEENFFRLEGEHQVLVKRRLKTMSGDVQDEIWPMVIPTRLKAAVMRLFHGDNTVTGHLGGTKTFHLIADRFYWKGMRRDIRKFIGGCDGCMRRIRVPPKHRRYTFHGAVEAPMNRVAVDIVGPLTRTKRGNVYILTMYDIFSNWPEAYALSSQEAIRVIECLKQFMARHGVPASILSDRGANFLAKSVLDFLKAVGAKKLNTSAYHAAANGSCENFHKFLGKGLSLLVKADHSDWDDHLDAVLFQYRTSARDGTGVSPFQVLHGRNPNLPLDALMGIGQVMEGAPTREEWADQVMQSGMELRERLQDSRQKRFDRNARQDGSTKQQKFEVDDQVYLKFPKGRFRPKGGSTKLAMINEGPYTVTRTHENPCVYEVQHDITKYKSNVFVGRMIPFQEWIPDKDSIQFPFQEEDGGEHGNLSRQEVKDDLEVEPQEYGEETDEYQWGPPSEAPGAEQRRTHARQPKRSKRSTKEDEAKALQKPYNQTKDEAKASRATRAEARTHKFANIMSLHIVSLDMGVYEQK